MRVIFVKTFNFSFKMLIITMNWTLTHNSWRYGFPNTVGEYIGLEDNDGLSIYEGDIIEKFCNNRHTGGEIKRYEVVYDGESFCLKRNDALFGFGNRDGKILKKEKVIGNIYDNPELLSGSEV